jgi:hypothetical protein
VLQTSHRNEKLKSIGLRRGSRGPPLPILEPLTRAREIKDADRSGPAIVDGGRPRIQIRKGIGPVPGLRPGQRHLHGAGDACALHGIYVAATRAHLLHRVGAYARTLRRTPFPASTTTEGDGVGGSSGSRQRAARAQT